MSSGSKRKSKQIEEQNSPESDHPAELEDAKPSAPTTSSPSVLDKKGRRKSSKSDHDSLPAEVFLRIEEVRGVPAPATGQTADLYFQLDLGTIKLTAAPSFVVGKEGEASVSCKFHQDFIFKRRTYEDNLSLTLRSKALGYNLSFGKLVVNVEDELVGDKNGSPNEPVTIVWLKIPSTFQSADPDVQYNMEVKLIAKIVAPMKDYGDKPPCLVDLPPQNLYLLPDPKGTLLGHPISALLFLHRSVGAEKIAKGSLLLDSLAEEAAYVDNKLYAKRRGFFSSGEPVKAIFPGVSAVFDAEGGLMERDAQDLIAKAASSSANSSGGTPRKTMSASDLAKSPRFSQRASLLFRSAPKETEYDEVATTYCWKVRVPVPSLMQSPVTADKLVKASPSTRFSDDGSNVFSQLNKGTKYAGGVRHILNARCGLIDPAQAEFLVHAYKPSPEFAEISVEKSPKLSVRIVRRLLHTGQPTLFLVATVDASKAKSDVTSVSFNMKALIFATAKPNEVLQEWDVMQHQWHGKGATVKSGTSKTFEVEIRQPQGTAGVPITTSAWESQYKASFAVKVGSADEIAFSQTIIPFFDELPEHLESIDQSSLQSKQLDTLEMNSTQITEPFIAIPGYQPGTTVSLFNPETGAPIAWEALADSESTRKHGRKRKSKRSSKPEIEAPAEINEPSAASSPSSKRKSKEVDVPLEAPSDPSKVNDSAEPSKAETPSSKRKSKNTTPINDK